MASAQLAAEEELQQSVVVSEEDLEREDSEASATVMAPCPNKGDAGTSSPRISSQSQNPYFEGREDYTHDGDHEANDLLASDGAESLEDYAEGEEDADGEDDDDAMNAEQTMGIDEESDAEGEEDDIQHPNVDVHHENDPDQRGEQSSGTSGTGDEDGLEDENDDEGVGAVKIRPGETDDDDDEVDSERSPSHIDTSEDSDGAAAWEDAPESHEDEDEESDIAARNLCLFCKQDEDHDPGEDFEDYLVCSSCGEHSHQYCAREAGALQTSDDATIWTCLACSSSGKLAAEPPAEPPAPNNTNLVSTTASGGSPHQLQLSLETSIHGSEEPAASDKHGELVVDDESVEQSRLLRKRKTSPVEPEDTVMSLRKRRRRTPDDQRSSRETTSHKGHSDAGEIDKPRKLRLKVSRSNAAVTVTRRPESIVVNMRVNPAALRQAMVSKASSNRKRMTRNEPIRSSRTSLSALPPPPFLASSSSQPFYSFLDRETDEVRTKPYGGILSDVEADTSRTLPTNDDRRRFDEAKQKAEEEWRTMNVIEFSGEGAEKGKKSKKMAGPASQIECIEFGGWEIDTWYAAPYPEEYSRNRILYICEFCLKYMNSDYVAWRHKLKCPAKHPPGDEIYRHGSVSVFEVDGRKNPVYCQNLCLLAKLFLGSKTLYYDVEPFLFYVLCEYDDLGYHFVGYFSKEKRASSQNNVSCILTLPIHQRKGYGNLLIDFSYLLTRVEQKTGSPEKPLSDMGLVSYRNYWRLVMCQYLLKRWDGGDGQGSPVGLSFRQISEDTGLTPDDVISALEGLRCLIRDGKTGLYAFRLDLAYCREYVSKWDAKQYVKLYEKALVWTPYVMGRGNTTNFELGPAITAMAPREEDEDRKLATTRHINGLTSGTGLKLSGPATLPDGESEQGTEKVTATDGASGVQNGSVEQVRESTEPHDGPGQQCSVEEATQEQSQPPERTPVATWIEQYEGILASRFEVFPPPGGRRQDRPRASIPRPSIVRTAPLSSNAKPRRSAGGSSVKRPAASRPKSSSSSRRKSGGTGRGPGRWPKGTKKSDYGNADSGPGLPPAWVQERQRLLAETSAKKKGNGTSQEAPSTETARVQFEDSVAVHGDAQLPGATAEADPPYTNVMSDVAVGRDE